MEDLPTFAVSILESYLVFILLHSSCHPYHFTKHFCSQIANDLIASYNEQHFRPHLIWRICSIWHWLVAFTLWHNIFLIFPLLLWQFFLRLLQRHFSLPVSSSLLTVFQNSEFGLLLTPCDSLCESFHSHGFSSHLHKIHSRSVCLIQISALRTVFPLHISPWLTGNSDSVYEPKWSSFLPGLFFFSVFCTNK